LKPRFLRSANIDAGYGAPVPRPGQLPPRQVQVASDLRRRIMSGEFGSTLPAERRLQGEYSVSQPTLRASLLALEGEGLIARRRGARHQVIREPERIIVDVDLPGPVKVTAGVATDDEREQLGLPVGAWVMRIWDLGRLDIDGRPILWQPVPAATGEILFRDQPGPPSVSS
jgi:DNA-binding GntR family transcriptional regulator